MMLPRFLPPLALATLLFSACGDSEPAPARQKLVNISQGVLHLPERELEHSVQLLDSDSEGGFDAWRLVGNVAEPLAAPADKISQRIDGSTVTLEGTSGVLYRFIEVKPNAYYAFDAEVRVEGLACADEVFFGATPWIAEMTTNGSAEELFAPGWQNNIYHREQFDSLTGTKDWKQRTRIFVTGPETKTLLIALCLAHTGSVERGSVSFRSVKLQKVPRKLYVQTRLDWSVGVQALGDAPHEDWRSKRLVRGNLGGEVRPAIVLLPGESLSFSLRVPELQPRFRAGIGFWDPSLGRGSSASQRFTVDAKWLGGISTRSLGSEANGDRSSTRWKPIELDLRLAAGKQIELTLSLEGDVPGMFGAPEILGSTPTPPGPNVVLISIDTLRADHVGAYGATAGQTPRIDAFASQGILFTNTVGQAPYTLPGHATILSGQHPGVHGLQKPGQLLSPLRSPLMTRILSQRGYSTQAFTGGGYVNAEFGFARDFDGFVNLDPWRHRGSEHFKYLISRTPPPIKRVAAASDQGLYITQAMVDEHGPEGVKAWISEHKDEPFFLFVHTFAIHDYEPPPGYLQCAESGCPSGKKDYSDFKLTKTSEWGGEEISAEDREHLNHRYDATLRFTDQRFGELLDHLDQEGLTDNTIVILTTDHGEEMFERGFIQHGKSLYEELTNIPLIMRIPGQNPRVISDPAMQVDILPTLLAALGIAADKRIQGIDLLSQSSAQRATWSEIDDDFVELYTYRSGDGWKLIHTPQGRGLKFREREEWQLFDLNADPLEANNLAAREPERLAALRDAIRSQRERNLVIKQLHADFKAELTEATKNSIELLGYGGDDDEEEDE